MQIPSIHLSPRAIGAAYATTGRHVPIGINLVDMGSRMV
jgi:hypothetical protein